MMDIDDIDIDSWGKKEEKKAKDRETSNSRKTDTPGTRSPAPRKKIKILTSKILGEKIEDIFKKERNKVDGIATLYSWIFKSNGKMRRSPLDCIVEIFRELNKEGWQ